VARTQKADISGKEAKRHSKKYEPLPFH